eukprot:CAMPEP_0185263408 /NCGR_PEP_ID=MMETSP1359-20130426/15054_1 /TAXON_ID=552665 /ORGANISM="Bigelowiella longifila, Strain CCMP242" /LENGTH=133 /DNA_ID=CAMNT_0027850933 /DNA_START=178 /DNA_END=579 /DNA_ORIENTATION=+
MSSPTKGTTTATTTTATTASAAKPASTKMTEEENECLNRCSKIAGSHALAGATLGLGISGIAARRMRVSGMSGALLISASGFAGGLAGLAYSTKVCMEEIMQLDRGSLVKRQLVGVLCQWNPGMAEAIEQARK